MPPWVTYMYFCGNGDTLGTPASGAMAKMVWRGLAQDFSLSTVVGLRRNAVMAASFVFGLALAISLAAPVDNAAASPGSGGGDQAGSAGGGGAVDGVPNGAGAGGAIPVGAGNAGGNGVNGAPRPGGGQSSSTSTSGGPGPEGNNSNNNTEPDPGLLPNTECVTNPDMCGFDSMGNPIDLVTGVTSGAPSPNVSGNLPTSALPVPNTTAPPIG